LEQDQIGVARLTLLIRFPKLATRVGCLSCLVTNSLDKLSF
jgi:hypothetical protein